MNLLLTSAGLFNQTLRDIFRHLLGEKLPRAVVAFITTAANVEKNQAYVDEDLLNLRQTGVVQIKKIDISMPTTSWATVLAHSDAVYIEGGNTFYLMYAIRKSGLDKSLRETVKDKLYVGVSAGSIVVTPDISIAGVEPADPNNVGLTDTNGLSWVDFEVSPHTPNIVTWNAVENYAHTRPRPVYAYDDNTAVLVNGQTATFVGEGQSRVFNK